MMTKHSFEINLLRWRACPAHAGIDPAAPICRTDLFSLPRSRGDRPHAQRPTRYAREPAPLTRGSTLRHEPIHELPTACPAHAGIDPFRYVTVTVLVSLPRSRGDRPAHKGGSVDEEMPAPLTRGSTSGGDGGQRRFAACPAHAGIDPKSRTAPDTLRGLPRSRGDRPKSSYRGRTKSRPAPLTRGSTPRGHRRVQ